MKITILAVYWAAEFVGFFEDRKHFSVWLKNLQKKANTPRRVSGKWCSYSPLLAKDFELKTMMAGFSKKAEKKMLKQCWGGWDSAETQDFIANRKNK